jgi:hypothetical protein
VEPQRWTCLNAVVARRVFLFSDHARDPRLNRCAKKPPSARLLRRAEAGHQEALVAFERARSAPAKHLRCAPRA